MNLTDKRITNGVDIKRFQYDEYATNLSDKKINLQTLLSNLIGKNIDMNCIMINLEKDLERYNRTIEEYKKVSISNFSHLKGTYWKNNSQMTEDINFVLDFMSQFNDKITPNNNVKFDDFLTPSDPNIHIQGGPLACYISHLRAMIWGWVNFKDYTIITEDDINITNSELIEDYISKVPDDWDIILLNACSKNKIYDDILHKLDDEFHSTHFYIINHKCMPFLFKNLYPITDQVDVLISDIFNKLNLYNIQDTVFQRNISTNTQNNLSVIFNSPHYINIRKKIDSIQNSILYFVNKILPNNDIQNVIISSDIMYDVIFEFILHFDPNKESSAEGTEDWDIDMSKYLDDPEYQNMIDDIDMLLQCTKKGIKSKIVSIGLIKVILYTINKFTYHNDNCKAYSFGSTAHTYLLNKKFILKKYNDKLRWSTNGHNNSEEIFRREIEILKKINSPKLISYKDGEIITEYCGPSLYNEFKLPTDWKSQITNLFKNMDNNGIFYPEFRLQNILILNDNITFVDYGMAIFSQQKNDENCNRFIENIELLDNKISNIKDRSIRLQLISTFMDNLEFN